MGRKVEEHPSRKMLEKYADRLREFELNMESLDSMEEAMISPKTSRMDGMPHGSGGTYDRIAALVTGKDDLEEKLAREAEEIARQRTETEALISLIDKADERAVLRLRYIDRMSWGQVARRLYGKAETHGDEDEFTVEDRIARRAFRVHGAALQSLAVVYDKMQGGSEA